MKYNLVTTKNGQFPINEIKEGMEVLCHGEWIKAPKPVKSTVITCSFNTVPTTSFEKQFIYKKKEVYCNHSPVLNKFESSETGLTVRAYLNERNKNSNSGWYVAIKATNPSEISYWYSRLIKFFNKVIFPNLSRNQIVVYQPFPKPEKLKENELAERNLEYYLEGLLRRRMFWRDNAVHIPDKLNETDKIVLRLLDIDCLTVYTGTYASNPVSLLKHIKDDYNKSRINEEQIRIMLTKSYELPQYTPGYKIISRKEETDWVLPGINPDINCLSPWQWEPFDKSINPQVRKTIKTVKVDSLGKEYKNQYKDNNLWEKLIKF